MSYKCGLPEGAVLQTMRRLKMNGEHTSVDCSQPSPLPPSSACGIDCRPLPPAFPAETMKNFIFWISIFSLQLLLASGSAIDSNAAKNEDEPIFEDDLEQMAEEDPYEADMQHPMYLHDSIDEDLTFKDASPDSRSTTEEDTTFLMEEHQVPASSKQHVSILTYD
eukprot:gene6800-12388_t